VPSGHSSQQAVNMDSLNIPIKLKDLFRSEEVKRDNYLFRLHHQANFFVLLFGVLFIFGENYLNGKSILCKDADDYTQQYCWLHGARHLPGNLNEVISGCRSNQELGGIKGGKHTHYYLWLPFILGFCMFIVKIPRFIWKHVFERNLMSQILDHREKMDKLEQKLSGISERRIKFYCFGFIFCELLNLISVLICICICDKLLGGKFWSYGSDYMEFSQTESDSQANPMCHLFPTEVSCDVGSGAITGGGNVDNKNVLCILSNNLFNQYYFFILWIWWTLLIILSILGLIYRVVQISIPWFCQEMFLFQHDIQSVECVKMRSKHSKIWDMFFLSRLTSNLNGEEIENLLKELVSSKAFLVQVDEK